MRKMNRKGFTILELLVVVAIIAILAVIAVPQFMGAIEKSRVSAQIADINAVSKAATMYNFDKSSFPATAGDMNLYINAFPAGSKWNGAFTYEKIAAADADLGLVGGEYVLKMTKVPQAQAEAIDFNVDQVKAAAAVVDDVATPEDETKAAVEPNKLGLVRYESGADGYDVYYVIGK